MPLDRSAFEQQAAWCRQLGSDFTAAVLDALVATLDGNTATGRKVIHWPGAAGPLKDVVPLRLSGALHAMVLSGQSPQLAALYPPTPMPPREQLDAAVKATVEGCDDQICAFLQFAPQTNEVARASLLMAGLCVIAAETDLPLAVFEIGASGGLNLNLDRFSHQLGGTHLGDPASPLRLTPNWQGNAPTTPPDIIARSGCDLNPIDVCDPAQATRLLSYIWPDQPDRLTRTRAAIALAQSHPPELAAADAADWVESLCAAPPDTGQTRVLMHSIAWQYMPDTVQTRITQAMEEAGKSATQNSPLAWLAFELNAQGQAQLTLRLWPFHCAIRVLADANPHVQQVTWHGSDMDI
nr:DUF2332 domain-containing protein [Amylibacter sp.]